MFLKFARRFSRNEPLTLDWLCRQLGWPLKPPGNLVDLVHLECVFDVLDLYLWLSYRFQDLFPDAEMVRELQTELDKIIQIGVKNIVQLVKNQEQGSLGVLEDGEEEFVMKTRKQRSEGMTQQYRRPLDVQAAKVRRADKAEETEAMLSHSKLAHKLVESGVVTKEMLQKLKNEWMNESDRKNKRSERGGTAEDKHKKGESFDDDCN
uniref:ATP-dependent RNA helicase SUV3 C-terminal domain-containing protein n=1 Tax=Arion vulgaris TaxID=1028688 RepID=A0A0B7B501_9EUPU